MGSDRQLPVAETDPGFAAKARQALALIAAILALLLVIGGIAALVVAISAAWSLYQEPAGIHPYASYFAGVLPGAVGESEIREGLGKLLAWLFVVLMLLVLGKLGSWAVGAGARLVTPPMLRRD